jgi:hypothetical protein
MSNETTQSGETGWEQFFEQTNTQFAEALEANMQAQAEFVDAWSETVESATDSDRLGEGVEGYTDAYNVWMEAATEMVEKASDTAAGEDIDVEEFRDIWLSTANQAFKEVMSTSAFAAATGQTVQDALELQQTVDESAESTLHSLGMATEGDIQEIGDRLVELERRQHAVERKLDRVLDHLEE